MTHNQINLTPILNHPLFSYQPYPAKPNGFSRKDAKKKQKEKERFSDWCRSIDSWKWVWCILIVLKYNVNHNIYINYIENSITILRSIVLRHTSQQHKMSSNKASLSIAPSLEISLNNDKLLFNLSLFEQFYWNSIRMSINHIFKDTAITRSGPLKRWTTHKLTSIWPVIWLNSLWKRSL